MTAVGELTPLGQWLAVGVVVTLTADAVLLFRLSRPGLASLPSLALLVVAWPLAAGLVVLGVARWLLLLALWVRVESRFRAALLLCRHRPDLTTKLLAARRMHRLWLRRRAFGR